MSVQPQEQQSKTRPEPSVPAGVTKSPASPGPGKPTPQHGKKLKKWLIVAVVVLLGAAFAVWSGAASTVWSKLRGPQLPEGFTETHGRLEATKIYITTKTPLRVAEILAKEGDRVDMGQLVARMDTRTLQAQLRQAEAQVQRAKDAKTIASDQVEEQTAELALAKQNLARSQNLVGKGAVSQQQFDIDTAKVKTAGSALQAAKSRVIESQSAIDAAIADADRLRVDVKDGELVAPRRGRIQYRLAEQGEVLPSGGRVLDMIDLTDVYMLFYLPEADAGRVIIGAEARLILDALPDVVIPATVYFVAAEAQFTPKTVETRTERQKLAFQIRARIDPELLRKYEPYVKTGIPGVIYVRLDPEAEWPERLHVKIPEPPAETQP
jgi:HlyD family secretion protein